MNRLGKAVVIVVALVAVAAVYVMNPNLPTPDGEVSATLYEPGELGMHRESISLTDSSRPTSANGDYAGDPTRRLDGFVWYPDDVEQAPFPLIVYSHGFMSSVGEADNLAEFLVPKGYVLVAVDYPLSNGGAPGGPTVTDVINQAGDVSFIIDSMLARSMAIDDELSGLIDVERIAAIGLSLGGLTTQLVTFHPSERDDRIKTAVSIAGPSAMLQSGFFDNADVPFMMIAGSSDAIVPYQDNAASIPDRVDNSLLVTLDQGSHTGFAGISSTFMRWFEHPDELVCPMLVSGLERDQEQQDSILEANLAAGITATVSTPCAMESFPRAMRPGQQQMLTRLAVYAFLESSFAEESSRRQAMLQYLQQDLEAENAPDLSVTANL
jgi:predicted dienelactone hydrolase